MLQEFKQLEQRHRALSHDFKSFAHIADVKYNYNKPDTKVKGRKLAMTIILILIVMSVSPFIY
jgi:hypothetical protein